MWLMGCWNGRYVLLCKDIGTDGRILVWMSFRGRRRRGRRRLRRLLHGSRRLLGDLKGWLTVDGEGEREVGV